MNNPRISLIVALSDNRVIGSKGKIPWYIKGEQKRFKEITTPHPIIMGRKTFESIGRILPNRPHIIVTRDKAYHVPGAIIAHSLEQALNEARKLDNDEIFIIGGGQLFEQAISQADRLYLTVVHKIIDGDAYFPDYSAFKRVIFKEDHEYDGTKYTFLDLER